MEDDLTGLLRAWTDGDQGARDRFFERVYPDLQRLAAKRLIGEPADLTLGATDLVNEAYVRLSAQRRVDWRCRAQFFALSATMIRRILVDHAKHRGRHKRGAGRLRVPLDESAAIGSALDVDVLAVDRALTELAAVRATAARIVELRFFSGLGVEETAATLGLSRATVVRRWRFARAWLARSLGVEA